jgi:hypothetical protein
MLMSWLLPAYFVHLSNKHEFMLQFFLNKNAVWVGILAGILIPFVAYAVILLFFDLLQSAGVVNPEGMAINFRTRTSALIAICLNIFPMNYYRKKYFVQSMRGIIFPTFLYAVVWVWVFLPELF